MQRTKTMTITPAMEVQRAHETNVFGMWVFLLTELMLFGALFTLYASYRYFYPAAFLEGSRHMNLPIGATNTVVLITSSLTMVLGVHTVRERKRGAALLCLLATVGIGIVFLALKGVEYYQHYVDGLLPGYVFTYQGPNAPQVELFFILYYFMTGVHAIHLIIGCGLVATVAGRVLLKPLPQSDSAVEIVGLYWHFVDMVWIFLLPLLYLVGTHG